MSVNGIDDKIALTLSRAVTRRTMLQRTMRWTLAAGAAVGTSLKVTGVAEAGGCGGRESTHWGCYCASTPSCSVSRCCQSQSVSCCGGADPRCDYWGAYCWCSPKCCLKPSYGYYSCCDCWNYGNNGTCSSGNTRCVCKHRHFLREC